MWRPSAGHGGVPEVPKKYIWSLSTQAGEYTSNPGGVSPSSCQLSSPATASTAVETGDTHGSISPAGPDAARVTSDCHPSEGTSKK